MKPLLESSFIHHGHGCIVSYVPPCLSCNNSAFQRIRSEQEGRVISWALQFIFWFQTTTATGKSCCRHSCLGWTEFELPRAVTEGAPVSGKQRRGKVFPSLHLWDHFHALPSHELQTALKLHTATGFLCSYHVSMNLPSFNCSCGRSQGSALSFHHLHWGSIEAVGGGGGAGGVVVQPTAP